MLDISTRMTPFLSHDDGIRIEMAASHIKQSIPLINAEQPFIRTGFEEQYLDYSSYLYVAKDNGVVTFNDDVLMIVKYDSSGGEIIRLDSLYGNREGFDKMLFTKFRDGDRFSKGDILARHSTINNDGFLTLGCNLKTTYISCPYNYKDSLLISESCANKMSTRIVHQETIDCDETIPILWNDNNVSYPQGTYVEKAKPIFVVKERTPMNPMHVVSKGEEILAPASGRLYYKIRIDEIVKTQNEEDFYENTYKEEITKEELISEKIKELYNMDDSMQSFEAEAYVNYYCPQLNKRRTGKSIVLTYWIVEECPLIVGCKLANRHGNKGVISKIYPDKKMPRDKFGEYADIVVSAMTVTSRMNTGQLFEMHMNRANHLYCMNNLHTTEDQETKLDLIEKMLSCAQPKYITDIFKAWRTNASDDDKRNYIDSVESRDMVQIVQPPFSKYTYEDLFKFCKTFGKMRDDLKEPLVFDGGKIRASFGHTFFYRLEHEPNKKYFARGTGTYGKIGQPARNNKTQRGMGAHRVGEMEIWCLLAHQAYENLLEFMVSKSDSISEAARLLKYMFDGCPSRYTPFIQTPGILSVFKTFVNASGYEMKNVEVDDNGNIIDAKVEFDKSDQHSQIESDTTVNEIGEVGDVVLDVSKEMDMLIDEDGDNLQIDE